MPRYHAGVVSKPQPYRAWSACADAGPETMRDSNLRFCGISFSFSVNLLHTKTLQCHDAAAAAALSDVCARTAVGAVSFFTV